MAITSTSTERCGTITKAYSKTACGDSILTRFASWFSVIVGMPLQIMDVNIRFALTGIAPYERICLAWIHPNCKPNSPPNTTGAIHGNAHALAIAGSPKY